MYIILKNISEQNTKVFYGVKLRQLKKFKQYFHHKSLDQY